MSTKYLTQTGSMCFNSRMSTNTTTPINPNQLLDTLRHLRFEMGIRNIKHSTSSIYFQIGMYASTSWVEIALTPLDLFNVSIFKLRSGKRTTMVELTELNNENLAAALLDAWCALCSKKGW